VVDRLLFAPCALSCAQNHPCLPSRATAVFGVYTLATAVHSMVRDPVVSLLSTFFEVAGLG